MHVVIAKKHLQKSKQYLFPQGKKLKMFIQKHETILLISNPTIKIKNLLLKD